MSQDEMQDMGFNEYGYGEKAYDDDDTLRGLEFEKDQFSSAILSESTNSQDCLQWVEQCEDSEDKHLREGWSRMPEEMNFLEVSIFSSDSAVKERTELDGVKEKREAPSVIGNAFGSCIPIPSASLQKACQTVRERSSYEIVEIVRVQQADLHDSFKKAYKIHEL